MRKHEIPRGRILALCVLAALVVPLLVSSSGSATVVCAGNDGLACNNSIIGVSACATTTGASGGGTPTDLSGLTVGNILAGNASATIHLSAAGVFVDAEGSGIGGTSAKGHTGAGAGGAGAGFGDDAPNCPWG